ncbi:AbrB/MazE/SpoVT family DNA-binding domain-containing protein [Phreatobacter sp. HK31-P]
MATTRLSTKGQLVVPKATRERMGLTPGTSFTIIEEGNRVIFEKSEPFASTTLGEVVGILKYDGAPKSIEEMQRGIDLALAERWSRKSRHDDSP